MKPFRLDVSRRLTISLFAAAGFTALASGIAINAFVQVRDAFDAVSSRHLPRMTAALQLAQQSEATVASAPAVAAATVQSQRESAFYRVRDQERRLDELLARLRAEPDLAPGLIQAITDEKNNLSSTFQSLNDIAEARINDGLRKQAFLDEVIALRGNLVEQINTQLWSGSKRKTATLEAQRRLIDAERDWALALDLLVMASVAPRPLHLDRLRGAFITLVRHAGQEPNIEFLSADVVSTINRIEAFGLRPNNIFELRRRELEAAEAIEGLTARHALQSSRLVYAVNGLISAAKADVVSANDSNAELLDLHSNVLAMLTFACLLGMLLVALYVSRRIVGRLAGLKESMVAGAAGMGTTIEDGGSDEIADMARALKVFVSARDSAEADLREARDLAEKANQSKTRFLAAASHDLRQPLQALGLFANSMASRDLAPDDRKLAGKIVLSVEALESLLDALLDISKLDAGIVEVHKVSFRIDILLDRLVEEFAPVAQAAGLSLRLRRQPIVVRSDPSLLERILRNFIANALRYTTKGGVLIATRLRGEALRIEVWDTGQGIPERELGHIFKEFHQVEQPPRDQRKGLGLGLAIVERTSKLLDHPIEVRSRTGWGSCFSVTLPLGHSPSARRAVFPAFAAEPALPDGDLQLAVDRAADRTGGGDCLAGRFILVIDDDPDVRDALRVMLESWGCVVADAASSLGAVAALEHFDVAPDLVLADYRLGRRRTGAAAITSIRTKLGRTEPGNTIPAIIFTGDTAPDRLRQARSHGFPVLHKPVRPDTLRDALIKALGPQQVEIKNLT